MSEYLATLRLANWQRPAMACVPAMLPATILDLDAPPAQAIPKSLRLSAHSRRKLMAEYYHLYTRQLTDALLPEICFGLEVRVLAGEADRAASVANLGDSLGEAQDEKTPLSCPGGLIRDFRDLLAARLADRQVRTLLNQPGAGGHILQTMARTNIPWIRLGLSPAIFCDAYGQVNATRVADVRDRLQTVVVMFCKLNEWI